MKNIYIFYIFGGGGGPAGPLRQTQGYQMFRALIPYHRADKCITRKKITASLYHIWALMLRNVYIWLFYSYLRGGGSWGTLTSNPGLPNFQGSIIPHHRADKCITRKKITTSFYNIWALMWRNVQFWLFYSYLGGSWGTLMSNPGLPNFQGSKISSQSRQMYNKKKNNRQFLWYMGPNVKKCAFLAILFIFGGSWGPLRRTQGYQIFRAVRSEFHCRAD